LIPRLILQFVQVPREFGGVGRPAGVLADCLPGVAVIVGSAPAFGLSLGHRGEK